MIFFTASTFYDNLDLEVTKYDFTYELPPVSFGGGLCNRLARKHRPKISMRDRGPNWGSDPGPDLVFCLRRKTTEADNEKGRKKILVSGPRLADEDCGKRKIHVLHKLRLPTSVKMLPAITRRKNRFKSNTLLLSRRSTSHLRGVFGGAN